MLSSLISKVKDLFRPVNDWRVRDEKSGNLTGPMTYDRALDWQARFGGKLVHPKEK